MKKSLFILITLGFAGLTSAQVEIDRPIDLTGANGLRKITNLETPVNGTDAVNKDYVDAAVAAGGGSSPTMISDQSAAAMNYGDALRYCNALTDGGHSDWRMPTWEEVSTVVSTGGVTVPNNASTTYFWVQPVGAMYNGGNYHTIRWFRLSDGFYGGSSESSATTRNVRCVR